MYKLLYSTDASVYKESPLALFYPKSAAEVSALVSKFSNEGIPIIARGAGTSLAGQVVGRGVILDLSRHMDSIIELNVQERWVKVQPGVILERLNRHLAPYNLFFGPETSTANRCTIGGMVGNNSCGSHSLVYGSTRDHILEMDVVFHDASIATIGQGGVQVHGGANESSAEHWKRVYEDLCRMVDDPLNSSLIEKNSPDRSLRRRNSGYALDEFLYSPSKDLCKLIAGSEGTLAIVTQIKLSLVPLPPRYKCVVCAHCNSLEASFEANLIALKHSPVAVELMDRNILELSKTNIEQSKNRFFVEGDPEAILIIELAFDSIEELDSVAAAVEAHLTESGLVYACTRVYGEDISRVWALRKAGLGLLSSMRGDAKPVSVIEDTAVIPELLPSYMREFRAMLDRHSLACVFHAHIGTGELHLRPILNLKKSADVSVFRAIAFETANLVRKYRGSLSGEHGDGRLRGEFLPTLFGEELYELMRRVKQLFDPNNIFNPGKIIDTPPMDTSLRFVPDKIYPNYNTVLDFSNYGGYVRAVEQCNGSGDCLKAVEFGGVMCPSYRATKEEKNSVRGRANVLREVLNGEVDDSNDPFASPYALDVLELCISCKGCKGECPSNVDMASVKAEYLQHYYDIKGAPLRSRIICRMSMFMKIASTFAPLYNFIVSNYFTSSIVKRFLNFTPKRSLPLVSRVALRTFVKRYNRERAAAISEDAPIVYLFADEFINYNEVAVGIEFVELLSGLGYRVIVPHHFESGRAAISKGFLRRASKLANRNVTALKDIVTEATPLVGLEPSAILSFRDEYPRLVDDSLKEDAQRLASNALLYDEFIMREYRAGKFKPDIFTKSSANIILHGHCHQKVLASVKPSVQMLSIPVNYRVEELDAGCCGMAGSFGYEKEHYDLSIKIGELKLFPAIKSKGAETIVSAPGVSCRQQIFDGTGRVALHPVQILRRALL